MFKFGHSGCPSSLLPGEEAASELAIQYNPLPFGPMGIVGHK